MEKKIEQYLPLYLGNKVVVYNNDGSIDNIIQLVGFDFDGNTIGYINGIKSLRYHSLGRKVKLILRPLSSMTEDDKLELYGMGFTCNKGMQILHPTEWNAFKPTQFQWLLSKGFDIFGLKEKGLCLYPEEL